VVNSLRRRIALRRQRLEGTERLISSGTVFYGAPLLAHYVTSKAGVIGFTRTLARELGEYHINVNAIAPGRTISINEVDETREALNQQRLQARSIKRNEMPQDLVGIIRAILDHSRYALAISFAVFPIFGR